MDTLRAVLLALIQGITEFLPISSSAHLILPAQLLGWQDQGLAFDVAVHLGTLIAVLTYFRRDLLQMAAGLMNAARQRRLDDESRLAILVAAATLPVVAAGLAFKELVATELRAVWVIAATTILFGLLLGYADRYHLRTGGQRDEHTLGWRDAALIGLAQCLALIPGTSRSGITMTAGLLLGLSRQAAARFSFLLSIPTILGAATLSMKDLVEQPAPVDWTQLALAFAVAGASAFACIRFFIALLERTGFLPYVIYRLLLGLVLIVLML